MTPALSRAQSSAAPVQRLGFVYGPNGIARNFKGINYWTPKGEGSSFELSTILTPLAPYRNRMLIVSGLAQHQADAFDDGANGDHTRGTSTWLTGVHPKHTEGADVRNGISADQIAAAQLGKNTALPSLELAIDLNFLGGQCENSYSCSYLNTLAWSSATTPLPTENNPRIVFERLFGDGGTSAQRLRQAAPIAPFSILLWKISIGCSNRWARRIALSSVTMLMRCRKWSGEFKVSKPGERPICRHWSDLREFPKGSMSTSP